MEFMFKFMCMIILLAPFMLKGKTKTAIKVAAGTLFIVLAPTWLVGTVIVCTLIGVAIYQSAKEIRDKIEKKLDNNN